MALRQENSELSADIQELTRKLEELNKKYKVEISDLVKKYERSLADVEVFKAENKVLKLKRQQSEQSLVAVRGELVGLRLVEEDLRTRLEKSRQDIIVLEGKLSQSTNEVKLQKESKHAAQKDAGRWKKKSTG